MPRVMQLDVPALTGEQREVYDSITAKRGAAPEPHKVWVLNPGLARHADGMGWYFQKHSSLPAALYELVTLLIARQWNAEYVWQTHAPRAIAAGIPENLIRAIREGREKEYADKDAPETVIIGFVEQLHTRHEIGLDLYEKAVALLGVSGVVDLTALAGYFTMLAATVKVFEIEPPRA